MGDFSVFGTEDGVLTGRIQNDIFPGALIHQARELPASMTEGSEERYILVSDLGNSLIRVNRLSGEVIVWKVSSDGRKPSFTQVQRNKPDGKRILVACRDANAIQVFDIDPETGLLSECRHTFTTGSDKPVCLIFR